MKTYDRIILINQSRLGTISLGFRVGEHGYIVRPYTDHTWSNHLLPGERAWWVKLDEGGPDYWVPEGCLQLENPSSSTTVNTINQKGNHNMKTLYAVRVIKVPSVKAQEAGEVEEIIVSASEVVAQDASSAVAVVSAANADKLASLKAPEMRVVVTTVG